MNIYQTALRKGILLAVVLCLLLAVPTPSSATALSPRYDGQAAAGYAASHWNDGVGVCDEFIKNCLKAGGVEILAGGVDPLKDALLDAGFGTNQTLKISADGVHALTAENPQVQVGDVLFFYCEKCQKSIHTAMIGGASEEGYLYTYAHNPGWDKVDWLGNFTHTLSDNQQHRNCYQYIVVSMDRNSYSHSHSFTSDLYETAHPHKMYAACACGSRYYLGWNATVSSCTTCNPPVTEVPVVTATSNGTAIVVQWTTVSNALEYQVWRSRSANGTYFKIYSAMGTKMVNASVTSNTTYYYKVTAVLEKDSAGNPTKTATSNIVSCTFTDEKPAAPIAPVISGQLNTSKKVVISWKAVSDAAKYEVWRSTSKNGTYTKLITTTKLQCTNSPKPNTYYYKVRAVDANGNTGNYSNIVCITVPDTVPAAPVILGVCDSNTKAVISWKAVSDAAKYEVWRSTSKNGTYTKLITTTKLQCTNTPKPNTYYYKVRAVDANGNTGNYSNIVCITVPDTVPATPVILGVCDSNTKAVISWNAVSNAAKYEVWRSTSKNGTYTKLITTTKLQCTNTPKSNTYYYKVCAISADGKASTYSNIVCVVIPGLADKVPVITGKLNSNNKVVISWNTVHNATKYEVWRSTSKNGTYTKLITTANLYCINSPQSNTYYYKVRAIDDCNQMGKFSNIISVTVK